MTVPDDPTEAVADPTELAGVAEADTQSAYAWGEDSGEEWEPPRRVTPRLITTVAVAASLVAIAGAGVTAYVMRDRSSASPPVAAAPTTSSHVAVAAPPPVTVTTVIVQAPPAPAAPQTPAAPPMARNVSEGQGCGDSDPAFGYAPDGVNVLACVYPGVWRNAGPFYGVKPIGSACPDYGAAVSPGGDAMVCVMGAWKPGA